MKRIKCGCHWRKPGELEIEVEEGIRGGEDDSRRRGGWEGEVEEG